MFGYMHLQSNCINWVDTLKGNRAIENHKTECLRCGFCCAVRPCIPTPDELKKIADFLKMDIKEAVNKYFVVDTIGGTTQTIIFPAKKSQLNITGTFISAMRTYDTGYCVFCDEIKKEFIINSIKPDHAKLSYCWKEDTIDTDSILQTWDNVNREEYGIDDIDDEYED